MQDRQRVVFAQALGSVVGEGGTGWCVTVSCTGQFWKLEAGWLDPKTQRANPKRAIVPAPWDFISRVHFVDVIL